jgi:hypothetical protein
MLHAGRSSRYGTAAKFLYTYFWWAHRSNMSLVSMDVDTPMCGAGGETA